MCEDLCISGSGIDFWMIGFIILMLFIVPYAVFHIYKEFKRFRTQNLQIKWVTKPTKNGTKTTKLSANGGVGARAKAGADVKPCSCKNKYFIWSVVALLAVAVGIGLWVLGYVYAIGSN